MEDNRTNIQVSIEIALEPQEAFKIFVEELHTALLPAGIVFEARDNGHVTADHFEVGQVLVWKPGEQVVLHWHQAEWAPDETTRVDMLFEVIPGGTKVTLRHIGWGSLIGDPGELAGWFASEVAAKLLKSTAPVELGDWITDRRARRPSGAHSRETYRAPLFHYPNFGAILAEIALTPQDYLLEVGCSGGALLKEALKSGCRAAGIDHSLDMVQLARSENHAALAEGRLEIRQANADQLPFIDQRFTCAVMTGVLGFLPHPVTALREIRRVLVPGGRFMALGSDPRWRGTMAAPEPMASRLHFYSDDELKQLATRAGFSKAVVVMRDVEPYARQAGIPEEYMGMFSGPTTQFLIACR